MLPEPVAGQIGSNGQRARLLEEVGRARHHAQVRRSRDAGLGGPVELENTVVSRPPTISNVAHGRMPAAGRRDRGVRRGRRLRRRCSGSPAAQSAAPAPVLAPNHPMRAASTRVSSTSHRVAPTSLDASSWISKTLARSSSSAGVSRSSRSVPSPASLRTDATNWLRGLCRPLPLPCAKTTTPCAWPGTMRRPGKVMPPAPMTTSSSRCEPIVHPRSDGLFHPSTAGRRRR